MLLLLLAAPLLLLQLATTGQAFPLLQPGSHHHRHHHRPRRACHTATMTASSSSAATAAAGDIPAPLLPRGLSDPYEGPLQDLVDAGVLTVSARWHYLANEGLGRWTEPPSHPLVIGWSPSQSTLHYITQVIRRRPDYQDRRGGDYVEPEEIYLVATAHTSAASAEAAARVIEAVQPHSVVLEMCKSRGGLTALNDSRLLDEVGWKGKQQWSVNVTGTFGGI